MRKISIELYKESFNDEYNADVKIAETYVYFASDDLTTLLQSIQNYLLEKPD